MWYYTLIGLFHLTMFLNLAQGQSPTTESISLENIHIPLSKHNLYYISDLIDERSSQPSSQVGFIYKTNQKTGLYLTQNIEKSLLKFYASSLPFKDTLQLPIHIAVQELEIIEKAENTTTISGQIKIKLAFHWYRQQNKVDLITYQAPQKYTRSTNTTIDYAGLLQNTLVQGIQYFDKWIALQEGKNPVLAKTISIQFTDYIADNEKDTLFYQPNRALSWNDFQASPSTKSRYAALIFTSFAYEGSMQLLGSHLQVILTMKVFMVKGMSWRKNDATGAYALAHEQLHFDIVQLIANRFKKYLSSTELSIEDYDSQIQYQYIEFFRQMNQLQKAYDNETNHGLNKIQQQRWQERITQELKEY